MTGILHRGPHGAMKISTTAEDLQELADRAAGYANESVSPNTRRGYASDWKGFHGWCRKRDLRSLPAEPQTVALYYTYLADAGRSYQTISRIAASIRWAHENTIGDDGKPIDSPTHQRAVRLILRGIARTIGRAARRKKAAATVDDVLSCMVGGLPDDVRGHRDRAVLLLGFVGAFRRSELASLRIEDVQLMERGATIQLRRSKTDQSGKGATVSIPTGDTATLCPVLALRSWLQDLLAHGVTGGYLVRGVHKSGSILEGGHTGRTVNRIVKDAAHRAGLDPKIFGAHSLRAGLATQAAIRGKNIMQIAHQGRWERLDTVLGYYRAGAGFEENAAKGIGL
jgi:site-specific recombinase XerD